MIASPQEILVCGDVSIDWVLTVSEERSSSGVSIPYQWSSRDSTGITSIAGGAALLADVLRSTAPSGISVRGPDPGQDAMRDPASQAYARTFSIWRQFPRSGADKAPAWRIDQFLGVQPPITPAKTNAQVVPPGSVVAIDDANLGFRDTPDLWPKGIENAAQVVLKMTAPLFSGPFRSVLGTISDRLTAYISLGDLRRDDASIGQSLSWEQLASEIRDEARIRLRGNQPNVTVITVSAAGAVIVPRSGPASLVYDPVHQEGDWEQEFPGTPIHIGTFVSAALVLDQINPNESNPSLAVARGLNMMRDAHLRGYLIESLQDDRSSFVLNFDPAQLSGPQAPFAIASAAETENWNLQFVEGTGALDRLARQIVIDGEQVACAGMPLERIGHWMSVDRTEIESVRSLRTIVEQYLRSDRKVRPLNIAVFGPPGSGKSFAVKQMCQKWSSSGIALDIQEFNVAQFNDPTDMAIAYQKIRDSSVSKRLPLVFWDEFDTPVAGRELGWLARFLAPMQDGTFLENGVERPIGSAVFVFAGGTHATLESFVKRAVTVPGAKATDFLSRLRGHVDVLGPNPRDDSDSGFVLRRALLIRALLAQRGPQLIRQGELNIDRGVLNALLHVPQYLHGARSVEAIIEMSSLSGRLRFERSLLPARHQLAMHVDPEAFSALVLEERD